MIGVVLWSDPEVRQAVFWCEDQGDLAYYDGASEDLPPVVLAAGDMVQFETFNSRRLRKACNAQLLPGATCPELPNQLRKSTSAIETSGNVLAFAPSAPHCSDMATPDRREN